MNETNIWLKWSQTMKAKPTKCVALGFKVFDMKIKNERFTPITNTGYAPFDPGVSIDGEHMKFIVNPAEKDPFKANHFKFWEDGLTLCFKKKISKVKFVPCF